MKEKQDKNNTKHVNIKMSIELYNLIESMAEESERNVSQQIRFIIQDYLEIKNKFTPINHADKDAM